MGRPTAAVALLLAVLSSLAIHCWAEHLDEAAVMDLPSDLTRGRVKGVSQVNYTNPECHLHPLSLSLTCVYSQHWEEQVVLHSGEPSRKDPAERSALPTMGYWHLGTDGKVAEPRGCNKGKGLAVYGAEVAWHCKIVRSVYLTIPFTVRVSVALSGVLIRT